MRAGLEPPKFEFGNFFTVIFPRPRKIGTVPKTTQKTVQKTTQIISTGSRRKGIQKTTQKTVQKILDILRGNPRITRTYLAEIVGITDNGIKYHLNNLEKKGVIRRVGPDKGGHWEIIK